MTPNELELLARLDSHIRIMAPHQRSREAGMLLADAAAAIRDLSAKLEAEREAHKQTSRQANEAIETANASSVAERKARVADRL